jgi:hypothetical protein
VSRRFRRGHRPRHSDARRPLRRRRARWFRRFAGPGCRDSIIPIAQPFESGAAVAERHVRRAGARSAASQGRVRVRPPRQFRLRIWMGRRINSPLLRRARARGRWRPTTETSTAPGNARSADDRRTTGSAQRRTVASCQLRLGSDRRDDPGPDGLQMRTRVRCERRRRSTIVPFVPTSAAESDSRRRMPNPWPRREQEQDAGVGLGPHLVPLGRIKVEQASAPYGPRVGTA